MKQSQRPVRILIGLAAVVAVGLGWWLFTRGGPSTAPLATAAPVPRAAAPAPVALPEAVAVTASVAAPTPVAPAVVLQVASIRPPAQAPVAVAPVPVSEVAPAPAPVAALDEVASTERMYLAHASLRAPEVADPDSETNRRILQTMVTKALAQPVATPSASAAP